MRYVRGAAALVAALALGTACSSGSAGTSAGSPAATPTPAPTPSATSAAPPRAPASTPAPSAEPAGPVRLGEAATFASGLEAPWGLAFLPDGTALVSERDTARIRRVDASGRLSDVGTVPGVVPGGEGGLMGLAVADDFARDPWLYAYFTAEDDNRIVRMRYESGRLGEPEVVLDGIAKASTHDGGRIVFGPDGLLYAGTGDAQQRDASQDRDSLNGKVLRIEADGSIPADNPFGNAVWSYGHRNVQGLAFDDAGNLWAAEFGQRDYDELNLIERGGNYGWPEVEGPSDDAAYVAPVTTWNPTSTSSPSGIAWARGTVFVAALAGERLFVVPLDGTRAGEVTSALESYGRIRTVAEAPDGSLWVITSNTDGRASPRSGDDRILRVPLTT